MNNVHLQIIFNDKIDNIFFLKKMLTIAYSCIIKFNPLEIISKNYFLKTSSPHTFFVSLFIFEN